jgi:hypothetical protein
VAGTRSQGSTPATQCGPIDIVQRGRFEIAKSEIRKKQKAKFFDFAIRENEKFENWKSEKSEIERKRFIDANRLRAVEAATAELSHGGMLRHTVPSLPERARLNRVPLSSCVSPMKRRYLPVSL